MRVHTYVIVVDSGAAPIYDTPCTTLAVCKPRIRRKANVGELVLAFADYWNDARFQTKKPDRA